MLASVAWVEIEEESDNPLLDRNSIVGVLDRRRGSLKPFSHFVFVGPSRLVVGLLYNCSSILAYGVQKISFHCLWLPMNTRIIFLCYACLFSNIRILDDITCNCLMFIRLG